MWTGQSLMEKFDALYREPLTGVGGLSEKQQVARNLMEKIFEQQGIKRIIEEPSLPYLSKENEIDLKSFEEDDIEILALQVK